MINVKKIAPLFVGLGPLVLEFRRHYLKLRVGRGLSMAHCYSGPF